MKKKYLSISIGIILLVLGVTAVAAVRNTFQKAFPKQTQQPTISPTPQAQISRGRLPQSCYENPESEECKSGLQEILDKECGGDPEAAACEPYFQEAVALQVAQECQKDPGECIGQEIRAEIFGTIFCEMAKYEPLGSAFNTLCQKFGGSTAKPIQPENRPYFGLTCSQNPNQEGCLDYCYQRPDELGCPLFLANHCAVDFGDPICTNIICTYAPNLCGLCGQFPAACEQILQRYLGL